MNPFQHPGQVGAGSSRMNLTPEPVSEPQSKRRRAVADADRCCGICGYSVKERVLLLL